jgi:3-oxoacyl-[acyl-carrier protein] reductase
VKKELQTMESTERKVGLITGVGNQNSIGYAIADQLASDGVNLIIHSFHKYDKEMSGTNPAQSLKILLKKVKEHGVQCEHINLDLKNADSPAQLINHAIEIFGYLDILVINHTHDTLKTLDQLDAREIDRHLIVNVRASLLLIQHFASHHNGRQGGRIIILTSGQHLGPMPHPAYIASKGALHHLTWSLSDQLIGRGITVNAVNPGPTRTYIPNPEIDQAVLKKMPQGRWGQGADAARLISWLVSDDARWITGQVIDSEGGFRRG